VPHLLNPLYDGVSWVLLQFHSMWSLIFPPASGAAWALSIVMLVVVLRIALIPVFVKQIKAQRGLQLLQPQMKALQTKYKNDRAKLAEEMQKLYKETGTNPLSSCLPLLVQSPFFLALYHVLSLISQGRTVGVITNMDTVHQAQEATIFGAPISASFIHAPNINTKIVAAVFIVLMTATTFTTQRQLMVKNMATDQANPMAQQQKLLLYVLPFVFLVTGINFPIGVLIYWLTTNLWTMGQQFYVIRNNPTPGSPAYAAWEARKQAKASGKEIAPSELPAAGGVVVDEQPAAPVRQQPKRQSRSQRSTPKKPPEPERPAG
jgi:YidC/Oxa1 family membrane protein insertase